MRRDALRPSSPVIGGAVRALVVGASVAALVGCGSGSPSSGSAGGALSSATSCADFLGAPESQRQAWFARVLERYGSDGLNNANVTSNIGGACGQFPQRHLGWATRSGVQSVAGQTYTGLDAASRPEGADGTGTAGTRGTASTERPEPSASVTGVTETKALLAGVTQYGTLLGAPDAPVTIHEFADVKCPACQQFEVNSQKQNVDELVKTGKANLKIHLVNIIDPNVGTKDGAIGRIAVNNLAASNKFFSFLSMNYYNQGEESTSWITEKKLKDIASQAPGVGAAAINVRETPGSRSLAAEADAKFKGLGASGTPAFFVQARGTNVYTSVESSVDAIKAGVHKVTR